MAGNPNNILVYVRNEDGQLEYDQCGRHIVMSYERECLDEESRNAANYTLAVQTNTGFPGQCWLCPVDAADIGQEQVPAITPSTAADIGQEQVPAINPSTAALLPATSDINIETECSDAKLVWTREAVLLLIELYQQFEGKMKSIKHKKKMLWSEIAERNKDSTGLAFTGAQVETKWKNITKKYRDVVDHNRVSGNGRKSCPFYEELSEFYGHKASVTPPATAAAGSFDISRPTGSDESSDKAPIKKAKKRQRTDSTQSQVLESIASMKENMMAMEKRRIDVMEKVHKEKMQMFGAFLDILKSNRNKS